MFSIGSIRLFLVLVLLFCGYSQNTETTTNIEIPSVIKVDECSLADKVENEVNVDYMALTIESFLERDFTTAEYYINQRNQKIINENLQEQYQILNFDNLFCITCTIYQESGGGKSVSCNEMLAQGNCVINRVNDPRFKNTIREVLESENQYANFKDNGVNLVYRGDTLLELQAIERSFKIALRVLNGEKAYNSYNNICPENMVWASQNPQGTKIWWHIGNTYFCI